MTDLCRVDDCDRPVSDAWVCTHCSWRLERALGNVAAYADELDTTLAKLRTNFSNGDRGRSREIPMPMHDPASEVAWLLRNTLTTWVRIVAEERGYIPNDGLDVLGYPHGLGYAKPRQRIMPVDTLASMAGWLLAEVEWLRHHRAGHEAVEEIDFAVWQAARIVDRPPGREYAGPCPDCGTDLYGRPGAVLVACRPCGVEYPVVELREWMKSQIYGRLVTAREGSALLSRFGLETKQATIDKWHQRGLVVFKGHNPDGHRMYLFDDLVTLAARAWKPDTPSDQVAI